MADTEQAERTEEPSERRLQQARERGNVPRSRELTNFATMIGGSVALVIMGSSLTSKMLQIMRGGLAFDEAAIRDPAGMPAAFGHACISALLTLLPLFGVLIALVLLASVALGGWNLSSQALAPDFSRLNPLTGLQRTFGLQGFSEMGKALLKVLVVAAVCAVVVSWLFMDVVHLASMSPRTAVGHAADLMSRAFVWLCAALLVVAGVDVPLQLYQYKRNLRMSRHELREEMKDSDGRPEVKSKIRQLQQEMAKRRMMHQVPTADVVIVNPTHFAVALRYDPNKMRAPRVLAKGVDLVAQNIRKIALDNKVPVFESPKLARALYRSTDLNA